VGKRTPEAEKLGKNYFATFFLSSFFCYNFSSVVVEEKPELQVFKH